MITNPKEKEEKIHNIQVVIDQLATEVLGVDLSHIEAQCIVEGSEVHIHNLLEIFDGLLDLVMEDLDGDDEENQDLEYDEKQHEGMSLFFLLFFFAKFLIKFLQYTIHNEIELLWD